MTILVSYGEIALKGRYVRGRLERSLVSHIDFMLKRHGYDPESTRRYGRIYVDNVPNEAAEIVSRVFGVVNVMPSTETGNDFESVLNQIHAEGKAEIKPGQSFAVRAKVVGDHPFGSQDVAVKAGALVLEALREEGVHVNLTAPDVTLYAEVREHAAFVYSRIIRGVKGLPYASQGRAVSLFSGGIDSPVSTWLIMKRGVETVPLFMDQRPHVGESYIARAKESFNAIASYVPRRDFKLMAAPMGKVMDRILEAENKRFTCIMCKRSMYRIASQYAEKVGGKAIITGESLGQVASQTLSNLFVLDHASSVPVLRPVIGLDKVEIEDIARDIGTYKITATTVNGCTAVPSNPATRSRLKVIEELEEELGLAEVCAEAADAVFELA